MQIELATAQEIPVLAAMNKRLIEDEHHPNPMTVPQLAERMTSFLDNGYTAYVARLDEVTVTYALYRDNGETYYLRQLYVERGFRRRGIATELLDWLFGRVWTDKPVRLDVLVHNRGAIAFYEAYGFHTGCLSMEKGP